MAREPKSKALNDGALEMTFEVAGLDEIKRWVLRLGKEAEAIEPDIFRDAILQETFETHKKYTVMEKKLAAYKS